MDELVLPAGRRVQLWTGGASGARSAGLPRDAGHPVDRADRRLRGCLLRPTARLRQPARLRHLDIDRLDDVVGRGRHGRRARPARRRPSRRPRHVRRRGVRRRPGRPPPRSGRGAGRRRHTARDPHSHGPARRGGRARPPGVRAVGGRGERRRPRQRRAGRALAGLPACGRRRAPGRGTVDRRPRGVGARGAGLPRRLPPRRRAAPLRLGLRPLGRPLPHPSLVRRTGRPQPASTGQWWADHIAGAELTVTPTTHLATLLANWPQILRTLAG